MLKLVSHPQIPPGSLDANSQEDRLDGSQEIVSVDLGSGKELRAKGPGLSYFCVIDKGLPTTSAGPECVQPYTSIPCTELSVLSILLPTLIVLAFDLLVVSS